MNALKEVKFQGDVFHEAGFQRIIADNVFVRDLLICLGNHARPYNDPREGASQSVGTRNRHGVVRYPGNEDTHPSWVEISKETIEKIEMEIAIAVDGIHNDEEIIVTPYLDNGLVYFSVHPAEIVRKCTGGGVFKKDGGFFQATLEKIAS